MNSIARVLEAQKREDETEALLNESLTIHCRLFGLDCPNRLSTLLQLAKVHVTLKQPDAAQGRLEELLASCERTNDVGSEIAVEAQALLERLRPKTPQAAR